MQANYYYIVNNGRSEGPYPKDILKLKSITPDTLVWCQGMTEWKRAAEVPDLADLIVNVSSPDVQEINIDMDSELPMWFAMINGYRVGPCTIDQLINQGLVASTPVWKEGMTDWNTASSQPEIMSRLNRGNYAAPNGYPDFNQPNAANRNPESSYSYNNQYPNQPQNQYDTQYNNSGNFLPPNTTNWLTWAIVATVIGALTNCISLILGIIAITQANKANTLYQQGLTQQAQSCNNSAKTLTIVAFILEGLTIVWSIWAVSTGLFAAFL